MKQEQEGLVVGGIYLIRKVGAAKENIFIDKKDYSRFLLGLEFYNSRDTINLWKLFFFQEKSKESKTSVHRTSDGIFSATLKRNLHKRRMENSKNFKRGMKIVSILGFALLPKSYYLLVLEIEKNGISKFMHKMGGYSSYFNTRHNRRGVLFRSQYERWRIKDKAQAVNVLNYIHTLPVKKLMEKEKKKNILDRLNKYRYSSFLDYTGRWNFASVTSRGFLLDYLRGKKNYVEQVDNYLEKKLGVES